MQIVNVLSFLFVSVFIVSISNGNVDRNHVHYGNSLSHAACKTDAGDLSTTNLLAVELPLRRGRH